MPRACQQALGSESVPQGPGKVRAKRPSESTGRIQSQRAKILSNLMEAEQERLAELEKVKADQALVRGPGEAVPGVALSPPVRGSDLSRRLYTPEVCGALADDLVAWIWESERNYLLVDWLVSRGIPQGSVRTVLKTDPVFCAAWDYAMTVQHARVLRRGLECRADAQVTKLVLMSAHGYKEQQEVVAEVGASRQMPGTIEEADRLIEALQAHRAGLSQMVEQARQIESAVIG